MKWNVLQKWLTYADGLRFIKIHIELSNNLDITKIEYILCINWEYNYVISIHQLFWGCGHNVLFNTKKLQQQPFWLDAAEKKIKFSEIYTKLLIETDVKFCRICSEAKKIWPILKGRCTAWFRLNNE